MSEEVVLRAETIDVSRGRRQIVHGVSLTLRRGELLALMGPNGAGKSTLLDALGGSLQPSAGTIERYGRVAVALQSPDLARRSVLANVKVALAWWGVPRGERGERALSALTAIGAEHLAQRPASDLSGGERRRVHLARVLALQPEVLMLDEPFAGLDAATRASLLDDTGAAIRTTAAAALVVVHDRAEAWALADRLAILMDGRLVAEGAPRALLEQPPSVAVARFLGFDGTLRESDGSLLLTRPQHVVVDPDGPQTARVRRMIPLEDGVRLELELDGGSVHALAPLPGPRSGEQVRVRLIGGVRFGPDAANAAEGTGPDQRETSVPEVPAHSRTP